MAFGLQNVNLAKNWDIIKDEEIRKEVYGLMDDLHNLYRDSQDFGICLLKITFMNVTLLIIAIYKIWQKKNTMNKYYIQIERRV